MGVKKIIITKSADPLGRSALFVITHHRKADERSIGLMTVLQAVRIIPAAL